jgi:hypothetical protein
MPPPVSPSDNRPYNDRLASILRKDPGYLTRAAWTPRELTDQFSWLPGAWNYTMLIHGSGEVPERKVSGSLEYRLSKNGSAIQLVLPGEEPMPYIIWDGFNGQFVLSMLTPRSFGSMISKGFRGDKLVFEGIMTFVGLSLNLRQTWTRQPAKGTFAIANEEALPNGKFAAVDEFAFVKA